MRCLKNGGDATAAVEVAIKCLEDREITNAGFGSNLNMDGTVEGDATVVDHLGRSGACGAVPGKFFTPVETWSTLLKTFLKGIKNPISLAKLILDKSSQTLSLRRVPPNILVGNGAQRFGEQHGMQAVNNEQLVSKNAQDRYERWYVDLQRAAAADNGATACQYPTNQPRVPTPSGYDVAATTSQHVSRREHTAAILTATWNEGQPDSPYHSGPSSEYASAHSSADTSLKGTPVLGPSYAVASNPNAGPRSPPNINYMPNTPARSSQPTPFPKRSRAQMRHTDEPTDNGQQPPSSPSSPPKKRTRTFGILPHDSGMSEDSCTGNQENQPIVHIPLYDNQSLPPIPLSPSLHSKAAYLRATYGEALSDFTAPSQSFLESERLRATTPPLPCTCCPNQPICRLQTITDSCKYFQRRRDWTLREQQLSSSSSNPAQAREQRALDDLDVINDTVGAIAIDLSGHIAAGSSSGGIGMKHRGRVGPAALVGVGTAVIPSDPSDPDLVSVAAVTSGTGEHMATTMASYKCAERLYQSTRRGPDGRDVPEDDEDAIMRDFVAKDFMGHPGVRNQPSAGAIGVMAVKQTRTGYYFYFAHNTDSFALASMSSEERAASCVMSRTPESGAVLRGGRKVRVD